jgi:hypothetical protein
MNRLRHYQTQSRTNVARTIILIMIGILSLHMDISNVAAVSKLGEVLEIDGISGPYEIKAFVSPAIPTLGSAKAFVRVNNAQTGNPVSDADVRITITGSNTNSSGWVIALNSPDNPETYSTEINFQHPGKWLLNFQVTSVIGIGHLDTTIEVPPSPRSGSGIVIWLLILIALGAITLRIWWGTKVTARARRQT